MSEHPLPRIGAPATRALNGQGITSLEQAVALGKQELLALHGVGPKAIRILSEAAQEHGLQLAD